MNVVVERKDKRMANFENRAAFRLAKRAKTFLTSHAGFKSRVPWIEHAQRRLVTKNGKPTTPKREFGQLGDADQAGSSGGRMPIFFVVGY